MRNDRVILADRMDGAALDSDRGPFQLIVEAICARRAPFAWFPRSASNACGKRGRVALVGYAVFLSIEAVFLSIEDAGMLLTRLIVQTSVWLAVLAAFLFLPAGTMAWPEAWSFLAIIGGVGSAAGLWFARHDPGLLKQRLSSPIQPGQPMWDKAILSLFFVLYLASFVVTALDAVRWHTTRMPGWIEAVGAVCILASYAIIWRVLAENSFAAPVVKIQEERGQRIVTTGPYAIVRHPMYGGAILFLLGTPLLLGSSYGLVFVPVLVILLAIRSVFEERTLAGRFPEYAAYAEKVHYRFAPFIW